MDTTEGWPGELKAFSHSWFALSASCRGREFQFPFPVAFDLSAVCCYATMDSYLSGALSPDTSFRLLVVSHHGALLWPQKSN